MNVGIFGGSFDPPHSAHLRIAEFARSNFGLELILWVPAYDPPHKSQKQLTHYQDRLEWCGLPLQITDTFGFLI